MAESMFGNLKQILFFLIIFSFVTNALTVLSIATVSFSGEDYDTADAVSRASGAVTIIVAQVGGGIGAALAVGVIGFLGAIFVGIPGDKALGLSLFTGVLTNAFIGSFSTIVNMVMSLPIELAIGVSVVASIFFGIIGLVVTWALIETLLGGR